MTRRKAGDDAPQRRAEPMPAWAGGSRRRRQPYVRPPFSPGLVISFAAVALLLFWVASPPGLPSGPLSGKTRVVDGDTLDVANRRVRLAGIDAPERDQQCSDTAGQPTDCGEVSRRTLADLVGKGPVTCTPLELDPYGRIVATCAFGGADLGEVMVSSGQAVATNRYEPMEIEAKAAGRGIWAGRFDTPAQWRRTHGIGDGEGAPEPPVTSLINWVGNMFFR